MIGYPNISYDQSSLPPHLNRRWLPSQYVFHSVIAPISKGKEPPYVFATISVDDHLVATSKTFTMGLSPTILHNFLKKYTIVQPFGCSWPGPS
jgi:hypothetical protein